MQKPRATAFIIMIGVVLAVGGALAGLMASSDNHEQIATTRPHEPSASMEHARELNTIKPPSAVPIGGEGPAEHRAMVPIELAILDIATRAPVSGAVARLVPRNQRVVAMRDVQVLGTANAEGIVTIRRDDLARSTGKEVAVYASGYLPRAVSGELLAGAKSEVLLTAAFGIVISCVDPSNQPISGVHVALAKAHIDNMPDGQLPTQWVLPPDDILAIHYGVTDSRGEVHFGNLAQGEYAIYPEKSGYTMTSAVSFVQIPTDRFTVTLSPLCAAVVSVSGDEVISASFAYRPPPGAGMASAAAQLQQVRQRLVAQFPTSQIYVAACEPSNAGVCTLRILGVSCGYIERQVELRPLTSRELEQIVVVKSGDGIPIGPVARCNIRIVDSKGNRSAVDDIILVRSGFGSSNANSIFVPVRDGQDIALPLGRYQVKIANVLLSAQFSPTAIDIGDDSQAQTIEIQFHVPLQRCKYKFVTDGTPAPASGHIRVSTGGAIVHTYIRNTAESAFWLPCGTAIVTPEVAGYQQKAVVVNVAAAGPSNTQEIEIPLSFVEHKR
jgi:hypothetical protein